MKIVIPTWGVYTSAYQIFASNKFDMEVITLESEAYKNLVEKIDAIADYVKSQDNSSDWDDEWVDSYEVCSFLKISERTLQRLRTNGTITYSIISGKTYYTISEIKRVLKERLIKATEEQLRDLIEGHKEYLQQRKKNKPKG